MHWSKSNNNFDVPLSSQGCFQEIPSCLKMGAMHLIPDSG